jgi:histidine ammonia-lyase
MTARATIVLTGESLSVDDVARVANGAKVALGDKAKSAMELNYKAWLGAGSPDILAGKESWLMGVEVSATNSERIKAFVESHCAGVGAILSVPQVRALMLCRANVFATGLTGARPEAPLLLIDMINHGVYPEVPSQGSVGAAGDLAPLAAVARVAFRLGGYALVNGERVGAVEAMSELQSFEPTTKEALSFINGATLSVALAAIACKRAEKLLSVAEVALAMTMEVVRANTGCISVEALMARGHDGAVEVARSVSSLLEGSQLVGLDRRADSFSVRCAPAVMGTAHHVLAKTRKTIEVELNGACDNPLVMNDGRIIEAGNFHGAPIGMAMDSLKIALTQVATIPTGQHHEDHVSMAPIAAFGCLKVIDGLAEVLAVEILCASQGLDLRKRGVDPVTGGSVHLAPKLAEKLAVIREDIPFWTNDGVMHRALEASSAIIKSGRLFGAMESW